MGSAIITKFAFDAAEFSKNGIIDLTGTVAGCAAVIGASAVTAFTAGTCAAFAGVSTAAFITAINYASDADDRIDVTKTALQAASVPVTAGFNLIHKNKSVLFSNASTFGSFVARKTFSTAEWALAGFYYGLSQTAQAAKYAYEHVSVPNVKINTPTALRCAG